MSGLNAQLAVFYHAGNPIGDTFDIKVDIFSISWNHGCRTRCILKDQFVPLSRESSLEWVGFDVDQDLLLSLDSKGGLSCLLRSAGWQWIPLLDIHQVRKTIDHKYWPIMVKSKRLVFVLLNGENKPAVYPQPVVSMKTLRVPVSVARDGSDLNEAQREQAHQLIWDGARLTHLEDLGEELSSNLSSSSLSLFANDVARLEQSLSEQQLVHDKAILAMLQDVCRSQKIPLALGLVLKIRTDKVLEAAIKVANHFGCRSVAEAIDGILQMRLAVHEQEQQQLMLAAHGEDTDRHASSNYLYGDAEGYAFDEQYEQQESQMPPINNTLTRKVSQRQQAAASAPPPSVKSKAPAHPNTVSPFVDQNQVKQPASLNPFAVNKTGSTPMKRKNEFETLQELKSSPSPMKKPTLNVSPFHFIKSYTCIYVYICVCLYACLLDCLIDLMIDLCLTFNVTYLHRD